MRGICTAGTGVGIMLAAMNGFAQEPARLPIPTPSSAPVARIVRIRPIDSNPADVVSRSQAPDGKAAPNPMPPLSGGPPSGGGASLGTPRQYPNPTVTAEPQGGAPAPNVTNPAPAATLTFPGQPVGGQPSYGPPPVYSTMPPGYGQPPVYTAQPIYGQPIYQGVPGQSYNVGGPIPVGPPQVINGPVTTAPVMQSAPAPVLQGAPAPAPLLGSRPLLSGPASPRLDAPLYGGAAGVGGPAALLAGPSRFDFSADFLLWFIRSPQVPPLITTSSVANNGILGRGDTRIIFGNDSLATTAHGGGRFGASYWLTENRTWALDGSIFFLGRNGKNFTTNTNENALLARPFFNVNQGIPFSEIVAAPGLATGSVSVVNETQLWGADVNFRRPMLMCSPCVSLDLFAGFKFLSLTEGLSITETFARTPNSSTAIGAPNALFGSVTDSFRTANHFYGGQLGATGQIHRGRWTFEGRASVALGTTFQYVEVGGGQIIQTTTGQTVTPGGLLAVPGANIGTFTQHVFGVVPEAALKISYDITQNLRFGIGYNLIYMNSVVRPGDQIDTNLDVTKIPNFPLSGPIPTAAGVHPTVPFRTSGVFAQGINFSLQYRW